MMEIRQMSRYELKQSFRKSMFCLLIFKVHGERVGRALVYRCFFLCDDL